MAINYPTSLDSFTNPTATDLLTSPSHAQQHADINDAMEAVQTKLAIGNTVIGTYIDYSASVTISKVTLGNATIVARYARVNNFVHYWGNLVFGSTTSVTGSGFNLRLPVNAFASIQSTFVPMGLLKFVDASAGVIVNGTFVPTGTANLFSLQASNANTTYVGDSGLTSSVPFTWATSDRIQWNLYYEAA